MICKFRRCVYVFVAVSTLGLVAGCSDAPLSDIAKSKPDSDLVGTWYYSNAGMLEGKLQEVYLHIGYSGDVAPSDGDNNFDNKESEKILYKNLMRAIFIRKSRTKIESKQYIFFTTKIGKMRFANVPFFSKDNKISYYSLHKYEVSGNQLILWGLASDKAIKAGELKGSRSKLTDTTENIVRYLEQGGDKTLFPDSGKFVYQRVKPTKKLD